MKTNTFKHLENLCRAKGIICERYSRRDIRLTTPNGNTEAECHSVAEALDTLTESPFADLPLILRPASTPPTARDLWLGKELDKAQAQILAARRGFPQRIPVMDATDAAREGYTKNNAPQFDPPNRYRMFSVLKKMDTNGNSVLLIRDLRHGNRKRFQIDPALPGSKSAHEHGRDYLRSIGIACDAIALGNLDAQTVLLSSDFATPLT